MATRTAKKPAAQPASQPEVLSPRDTALAAFSATESGLARLREQYAGREYDVTSTKGMAVAKEDRGALRELRVTLEKRRKDEKQFYLDAGRAIDSEAKRIEAEIRALEEPIDAVIKAEEDRKERERQAKIEAERQRVEAIQQRIEKFNRCAPAAARLPSSEIAALITRVESETIDESYAEFADAARAAKHDALGQLREILADTKKREDEAEQLKRDREELERLRAEQAERDRLAEEQRQADAKRVREEAEAEARKIREAAEAEARDRRAKEDADRAAREQRDADERVEKQRVLDEQQKAIDAENARIARERAEREEADRVARENREREERERAIRDATLVSAGRDAVVFLGQLGHADHLITQQLVAALERESAPAAKKAA